MGFAIKPFFWAICLLAVINVNIAVYFTEQDLYVLSRNIEYRGAIDLCRSQGMNLVKIEDEYSNQLVFDFAFKRKLGHYWIDANDIQTEGSWVYNDGNRIVYSKWHPGEPNNYDNEKCAHRAAEYPFWNPSICIENCAHGFFRNSAYWGDIGCHTLITAICYAEKGKISGRINEYQLVTLIERANFKTAVNLCKQQGMNLVKIQNEETDQIIYNYSIQRGLGYYWIDANDMQTEGSWVYNDGNRIVYSKWSVGQPDNHPNGQCWSGAYYIDNTLCNENCAHGSFANGAFWNDNNCNLPMSVICYRN